MMTRSVVRHWFGDGWSTIRYQGMGCSFTKNEMLYAYDNIYATKLRIGVYLSGVIMVTDSGVR